MSIPIEDNEIRIIGQSDPHRPRRRWPWAVAAAVAIAAVVILVPHGRRGAAPADTVRTEPTAHRSSWLTANADLTRPNVYHMPVGVDTTYLHIYLPIMATAELALGIPDTTDPDILMAVQAADLRRDNGRIVGAFVLHGEPLSWGLSKQGYCAIIDGHVSIGTADNSPLFEQATDVGGDFFRQYSAVSHGEPVSNNPENRSYRRALCTLEGRTCLICSHRRLTMNDFAISLATLGVEEAVFLVGGSADGWVRADDGHITRLGDPARTRNRHINYLVFRRQ